MHEHKIKPDDKDLKCLQIEKILKLKVKNLSIDEQKILTLMRALLRTTQCVLIENYFENLNKSRLGELTALENEMDELKKELTDSHFSRLAEGDCHVDVSPYYSSTVAGLERVADHLVNIGYSIVNPIGSEKEIYGRYGNTGARPKGEVAIHSLRGGDVVGDHTVIFATEGERIEFTHKATSRANFAAGALRAAKYLIGKKPGLYTMADVIGLK